MNEAKAPAGGCEQLSLKTNKQTNKRETYYIIHHARTRRTQQQQQQNGRLNKFIHRVRDATQATN